MVKNKIKLSLCLIVKPDDREAELLDRCLSYIARYVDEICLNVTGKNDKVEKIAKKYKAKTIFTKWDNDFSSARNLNFSKATGDYILWLDCDDILKNADQLSLVVNEMNERKADVGIMDYLYDFDKYGNCIVKHRKTRIVKNDGCVKWVGIVHEDFSEERRLNAIYIKGLQVIHLTDNVRVEDAKLRNLEIAKKSLEENPKDPRSYWLVANAYLSLNKWSDSVKYFQDFIPLSSSEIEIFTAYNRMAMALANMKEYDRAVELATKQITLKPHFPDGYLTLGEIYLRQGQPKKAKEFLIQGLTKEIPEDEYIVWNPRDYDFNPLRLLAQTYFELNKPKEAKLCLNKCLEIYPKDEQIKKFIKAMDDGIKLEERVEKIFEESKKFRGEELRTFLNSIPDDIKSHPKLCYLKNINFIKRKSSGKDLVIYCYQTAEPFNPDIIRKAGRGGSEEAVYHASKRLSDMGWNVEVYANTGLYYAKKYGNVIWKPFWEFNARDKQDILIIWRNPLLFDFDGINAGKKYVWMHDVMSEKDFSSNRLDKIDKILVLSKAQRDLFPNIPDNKFIITGNGLDLEDIGKVKVERNPYRLIYTSSYDRGLECLLKLFPTIRSEIPQAELHVFYGWSVWDAMYQNDQLMKNKKEVITRLLNQPGVYEHGRVNQEQILKEYAKSSIWAYPTEFFEISCITAMKAQALGCIPISTNVGALDETIQFGLKVDNSSIYSDNDAQKEWVTGVLNVLKKLPKESERKEMVDWARKQFNWDIIINNWNKEFKK
jgi:glycosyltransferase involved in cell wall biosynthesis